VSKRNSFGDAMQRVEIWRRIPSFPNYEASSFGRIRRGDRTLKLHPNKQGYLQLNLSHDGKVVRRSAHTLVCEAFHGRRPWLSSCVVHGDGNIANNREDNLRWATHAENSGDLRDEVVALLGDGGVK
jgi:hypothetical protein